MVLHEKKVKISKITVDISPCRSLLLAHVEAQLLLIPYFDPWPPVIYLFTTKAASSIQPSFFHRIKSTIKFSRI